jgi:hypothetical protein
MIRRRPKLNPAIDRLAWTGQLFLESKSLARNNSATVQIEFGTSDAPPELGGSAIRTRKGSLYGPAELRYSAMKPFR